jgi:hypothetical protein
VVVTPYLQAGIRREEAAKLFWGVHMHTNARPNASVRFTALGLFASIVTAFSLEIAATTATSGDALAIGTPGREAAFSPPLSTSPASSGIAELTSNSTLTITGTPANSVAADQAYAFQATPNVPAGKTVTFEIINKPVWASFDAATGALRGTPSSVNVGSYPDIMITASDGAATVRLPTFAIAVTQIGAKSATLSWIAPTENSNGTPLTNLAGYRIAYGTSKTNLSHKINVNSAGLTTYVISNLNSGTYYFTITAFNSAGLQSKESNIVSAKL